MTDSDPFQVLKSMALFMQIFNLSNLQDDIPNTQSLSLSLYLFHFQGFEINGSLHANLQPNLHDVPHLPLVRLSAGGHDDDSIKFYHLDKVDVTVIINRACGIYTREIGIVLLPCPKYS